jgi:hypothetical protein
MKPPIHNPLRQAWDQERQIPSISALIETHHEPSSLEIEVVREHSIIRHNAESIMHSNFQSRDERQKQRTSVIPPNESMSA